MPELPEVHTTVTQLKKEILNLNITDSWSGYESSYYLGKPNIKDRNYFKFFKNKVVGQKILGISRLGKNIIVELKEGYLVIHMKMTGHLLLGHYRITNKKDQKVLPEKWQNEHWVPDESKLSGLWDPFNRRIRFTISLSDKRTLVLSDVRKFANVRWVLNLSDDPSLKLLGPDMLGINYKKFKERIMLKPNGLIKTVLLNQEVLAGIGNIYSDEALYLAGIHPESRVQKLPSDKSEKLFKSLKTVLEKGVKLKGDSTSDYRQPNGQPGNFQHHHRVYRRKKEKCLEKKCSGRIQRKVVQGRSAHFCEKHQKMF